MASEIRVQCLVGVYHPGGVPLRMIGEGDGLHLVGIPLGGRAYEMVVLVRRGLPMLALCSMLREVVDAGEALSLP